MDSSKIKLSALLLAILLPIGLATVSFILHDGGSIGSTTNKGRLIMPVLDITDFGMVDENGGPLYQTFEEMVEGVDPADYEAQPWKLIFIGRDSCDEACAERLYYLRQMHVRLGPEASRVERLYLLAGDGDYTLDAIADALLARDFPEMKVVAADEAQLREALARTHGEEEDPIEEHFIYMVDPVGNSMLYFTPDNGPEEILQDVEKLLDQSSLG